MLLRVALLALSSAAEPQYPLGPQRFPDLTEPARPFQLTDLRYRASDEGGTSQSMDARVRVRDFLFVEGEVEGQRLGLGLSTQRLFLAFAEEQGRYDLRGSFRAPWFLLESRAQRRPVEQGRGWVLDTTGALRAGRDLEVLAGYQRDLDPDTPMPLAGRALRSASLELLYQGGSRLELSLDLARLRIRTLAGIDLDRDRASLGFLLSPAFAELQGRLAYEDTSGRLPRQQTLAELDGALRLAPRVVVNAGTRNRWEHGLGLFESRWGGGVTLFGRRHTFARGGRAAELTTALARRAVELGMNERRDHTLGGRRALRERLALSPRRAELRDEIEELHRAQVAERNLPQLGVEVFREFDDVNGTKAWVWEAFVGVPWPPDWPWSSNEEAVEFLTLSYRATHRGFEPEELPKAVDRSVSLNVALDREKTLRLSWSKEGLTPTDFARFTPVVRRLTIEYVYAFGR